MVQISRSFLREQFLSIDVRTLGLARIAIALMLLFDLAKRTKEFSVWYSETGLLPKAMVEAHPIRSWGYSLFTHVSSDAEARIAFVLIAIVYLCLLAGVFTRLFQILSFVCLTSLQIRMDFLVNGGDFVFSDLILWTAFLPLGATFSVDAWRRRRAGKHPARSPHVSWAVLIVMLQLAVIYFFNAVQKGGPWIPGMSVYWVVYQEPLVTWFGVWLRGVAPLWVFQAFTYSTLAFEYALPWLILSPWGRPYTRRIAILCMLALHLGIAAVTNVGLFSFVMLVYGTLLVSKEDWNWLSRKIGGRRGEQDPLVKSLALPPPEAMEEPRRSPWRWVAGPLLAYLVLVAGWQVLEENNVPRFMKPAQPQWIVNSVMLFRLNQGWKMFAHPSPHNVTLVVDAITEDGRHFDPLNELASRVADPKARKMASNLSQNYYWCDYIARIKGFRPYHSGLVDWIYRYHERTGNDADRIVSFTVYELMHAAPNPGRSEPSDVKARLVFRKRR